LMAFRTFLGPSNMLAYLSMMAPRLVELRDALKPTGSLYLHCDPTASHYLKIVLDAVFGIDRFRSEIIWKRTTAHNDGAQGRKQLGRVHDVILVYSKSDSWTWNPQYTGHDPDYVASKYPYTEAGTGRRYGLWDMSGPGGAAKGNPSYEVMGVTRYWRYSQERMSQMIADGLVVQPNAGKVPRQKRYLDETAGLPLQDVWTDISPINSQAAERLGYPTQKPVALLERIVAMSTNPGDVVLDPFCGCGTTVDAAEKLGRSWVGIDITHLSINLIKHRLMTASYDEVTFSVVGEPNDEASARQLAAEDPYQFQFWALGLVGARPVDEKKGADKGIDGRLFFHDEQNGPTKQIIFSVKAGKNIHRNMVHELRGVVEREGAAMGVLITMDAPTKPMREDAASGGFYDGPFGSRHPRLQLITVGELLDGRQLDTPGLLAKNVTLKRSPKATRASKKKATAAEPTSLFSD